MQHFKVDIAKNNDINNLQTPLPISVIPNYMGINLCSVDSMSWDRLDDGQLVNLTIHFKPNITGE